MKKVAYIKLSHEEANKKIWDSLIMKFPSIKQKNLLLGYLWLVAVSVFYGFIAIISWFSFLTLFFKDIRYTPHYMQTVIRVNGMTREQANTYLASMQLEYKKRLSYGNISLKEQSRMDATFEWLHKQYQLPELWVDKPDEVLTNLLEMKDSVNENFQELKYIVSESSSGIKTIERYANRKLTEEEKEQNRKQQLAQAQTNQLKSAYLRECGRNLTSFESVFTDKGLDMLVDCCNSIPIFTRNVEKRDLEDMLHCTHKEPLQVRVNRHIAFLFDELRKSHLICSTWMSVASKHQCFISKQNDKLLTPKDLSTALAESSKIKQSVKDSIRDTINRILSAHPQNA
ncbi:hypothetical protein EZS27_010503 [termite gut metagenome]|uniref:Uncharacterized protein n=1 Tax=termite gut metagenome TaxID=433724 RepID=A0A5J4S6N6_9ZZZZ